MKILKKNLQIAVDGPVAAGKGTTSKLIAERLHILYVDTGAMYRALAYFVKANGLDFEDEKGIAKLLNSRKPEVKLKRPEGKKNDGRLVTVFLNNQDISWKIRTPEIDQGVSIVTKYKAVRNYLVPQQRKLAASVSVAMEGRDITTRVLPKADLKIYMDGSPETRARRRYEQTLEKGVYITYEEVLSELQKRDYHDSHRSIDPLQVTKDAWVLDTTDLTIEEVIDAIIDKLISLKLVER
jgi:cytidylate kinase